MPENYLVKEFAFNGKNVKIKLSSKNGRYYFVVDGEQKWIKKKFLSEEGQMDIHQVRALWMHSQEMFNQGAISDFFKAIDLAKKDKDSE